MDIKIKRGYQRVGRLSYFDHIMPFREDGWVHNIATEMWIFLMYMSDAGQPAQSL